MAVMATPTLVVLSVLVLAVLALTALFGVAMLQRRRAGSVEATPPRPALGSPAQVLLERGERVGRRLHELGRDQPVLAGAGDDADEVVAELRAAATHVAAVDKARSTVPASTLRDQQRRLDAAIAAAAGTPAEADLRTARDSVTARLATAARHQAARDALLARMRAAVAGLEAAETELTALLTSAGPPSGAATTALADRLAGLRAGLAEVRAIGTLDADTTGGAVDAAQGADQGRPGDLPGSVEPPPRT
jgi:truncated hemoglobin YjbI